jgi:predicted transcriptional regulator
MTSRDKYDIFSDILKAAGSRIKGSKIPEVIKEASLNAEQAKEVVIVMLEMGLVEFNKEGNTLRTTEKGWQFVMIYQNLKKIMSISNSIICTPLETKT